MTAALRDPVLWKIRRRRFAVVTGCCMPPGDLPCTQVQCRYHLAHVGVGDRQWRPTRDCALSVANEGALTRDEVAAVLGISDERVRQIEERAVARLKNSAVLRTLFDELERPSRRPSSSKP
jgi:hypothetical protein